MYILNYFNHRRNDIALEIIHEPGMNMHIHWLDPLLSVRKSK